MALSEPVPMGQASSLFVQRRPQDTGALPERAKLCLLASPPPLRGVLAGVTSCWTYKAYACARHCHYSR